MKINCDVDVYEAAQLDPEVRKAMDNASRKHWQEFLYSLPAPCCGESDDIKFQREWAESIVNNLS